MHKIGDARKLLVPPPLKRASVPVSPLFPNFPPLLLTLALCGYPLDFPCTPGIPGEAWEELTVCGSENKCREGKWVWAQRFPLTHAIRHQLLFQVSLPCRLPLALAPSRLLCEPFLHPWPPLIVTDSDGKWRKREGKWGGLDTRGGSSNIISLPPFSCLLVFSASWWCWSGVDCP